MGRSGPTYAPQSRKQAVDRLSNVWKVDYEDEFDAPTEKDREFFSLVIQYGLDEGDSLEASEIRSRSEALPE